MSMSMTGATGLGSRGSAGNNIPKGYRTGSMQQYTPEQMNLFQQNMGTVGQGSQLRGMAQGDDSAFAPHEEYANRQFQEFAGQNASRFSGLGMGSRKGSGFQNVQTQGAQDFASQLAMQRQGLQRQALMDLMGISESLLNQRPQENFLIKKQQPWWKELLLGANERGQDFASAAAKGAIAGAF